MTDAHRWKRCRAVSLELTKSWSSESLKFQVFQEDVYRNDAHRHRPDPSHAKREIQTAPTPRQEVPAYIHAAGSNHKSLYIFLHPKSDHPWIGRLTESPKSQEVVWKNICQAEWTHRSFYTGNLYADGLSHRGAFTKDEVCTQKPLRAQAFTYTSFHTRQLCTEQISFI